jgi:hypothetical protein
MPGVIARRTSRSEQFSDQLLVGLLVDHRAVSGWARDASISASLAALLITFANAAAGIRHVPRSAPPGLRVLARWSFHTPRQETGSGKPTTGRRRNDLRAWPDCRLKLGHELHGRGLHMVWA